MIKTLIEIYRDPNEEENAWHDYQELYMDYTQPFSEFYTRFLHLAGTADILRLEIKRDLPKKLTTEL